MAQPNTRSKTMPRLLPLARAVGIAVLLTCAVAVRSASAAADAVASARFLAPFLDQQTIAVVQVDLTHCNPTAVFDLWVNFVPEFERAVAGRRNFWVQIHDTLTKAGLTEAYAVISLADVPVRAPLFVAPKRE